MPEADPARADLGIAHRVVLRRLPIGTTLAFHYNIAIIEMETYPFSVVLRRMKRFPLRLNSMALHPSGRPTRTELYVLAANQNKV